MSAYPDSSSPIHLSARSNSNHTHRQENGAAREAANYPHLSAQTRHRRLAALRLSRPEFDRVLRRRPRIHRYPALVSVDPCQRRTAVAGPRHRTDDIQRRGPRNDRPAAPLRRLAGDGAEAARYPAAGRFQPDRHGNTAPAAPSPTSAKSMPAPWKWCVPTPAPPSSAAPTWFNSCKPCSLHSRWKSHRRAPPPTSWRPRTPLSPSWPKPCASNREITEFGRAAVDCRTVPRRKSDLGPRSDRGRQRQRRPSPLRTQRPTAQPDSTRGRAPDRPVGQREKQSRRLLRRHHLDSLLRRGASPNRQPRLCRRRPGT